ncbi:hypothetical protein HMPREF1635_00920 [Clostridiales bacterium S5-A14a]|nr:hypothetical protein HMPREF1635_00920 [Clostridiales bacterium S5-A14a]
MQLIVNPGSTSTKLAIFKGTQKLVQNNLEHDAKALAKFDKIADQLEYRLGEVREFLKEHGYHVNDFDAIVGRGGLVYGIGGEGYEVDDALVEALSNPELCSQHASNLGGLIGKKLADEGGIKAYIYDAVMGSYLSDIARLTGFPEFKRQPTCHVLNSRAMAMKYCENNGLDYSKNNFIVAHIGGGSSMSAHKQGKIIDIVADDEGPMSPERSGGTQLLSLMEFFEKSGMNVKDFKKRIRGKGGLLAYLGTTDGRKIEEMYIEGDEKVKLVYDAMAYQISKYIGWLAPVLNGEVNAIIITGGLAHSKLLTDMVIPRVNFIAPVTVMPGECEMEALAGGGMRILSGDEIAKHYDKTEAMKRK